MILTDDLTSSTPNGSDTEDRTTFLRKIRIFTTQGHPEFHAAIMAKLIDVRARSGILSQAVAADGRARNKLEVDAPDREDAQRKTDKDSTEKEKTWVNDGLEVGEVIWGILGIQTQAS
jgi:hypothetical protein